MGFPYFIFKGVDSRSMGLWVSQYPDRIRASERVNQVTIPGRAGQLTLIEGEAVYEPVTLQIRVQTLHNNDFTVIYEWLSGAGELALGRDPGKAYNARIISEVGFTKYSNDIAEATIAFECEPFKHQYPDELPVVFSEAGTIVNSGNVPAKPTVRVITSGDGESTLTIGTNTMTISGFTGGIDIDCAAQMVINPTTGENLLPNTDGDFFTLAVGVNEVSWTGDILRVRILVNARWL